MGDGSMVRGNQDNRYVINLLQKMESLYIFGTDFKSPYNLGFEGALNNYLPIFSIEIIFILLSKTQRYFPI